MADVVNNFINNCKYSYEIGNQQKYFQNVESRKCNYNLMNLSIISYETDEIEIIDRFTLKRRRKPIAIGYPDTLAEKHRKPEDFILNLDS